MTPEPAGTAEAASQDASRDGVDSGRKSRNGTGFTAIRPRILSRYLLKLLIGPFAFATVLLTTLMLLNEVVKRFGDLIGKGLHWTVIAQVFVLSIPFILAMTLPMAVLAGSGTRTPRPGIPTPPEIR